MPSSVLLIDEEAQDRSLTAFMVLSAMVGIGLREVGDEAEFHAALHEGTYSLVITESRTSWAQTAPLLQAIRLRQPTATIVVFTSEDNQQTRTIASEEGAAHLVVKSSQGFLSLVETARESLESQPAAESRPTAENQIASESQSTSESQRDVEPHVADTQADTQDPSSTGSWPSAEKRTDAEPLPDTEGQPDAEPPARTEDRPTTQSRPDAEGRPDAEPPAETQPTAEPRPETAPWPAASPAVTDPPAIRSAPQDGTSVAPAVVSTPPSPSPSGGSKAARWALAALAVVAVGTFAYLAVGNDAGNDVSVDSTAIRTPEEPADATPISPAETATVTEPTDLDQLEDSAAVDTQQAVATEEAPLTLVLQAKEEVWVGLSVDGRQVLDAVLQAGEIRTFAGQESATMRVGNASGLSVSWNGEDLGSLGRPRQVRVVNFSANEYTFGRRQPSR